MSAKEMFEKLGYDGDVSCDGILYAKYINIPFEDKPTCELEQIDFDKQFKTVRKTVSNGVFGANNPSYITLEELQAINKQVEELGWNNEK